MRLSITLLLSTLAVSFTVFSGCSDDEESVPPTETTDRTPPLVAITDDVVGIANAPVTFTFTFSENVGSSFTIDDINVMGGTPGSLTVLSGTSATLVVTPPDNMTGTLTVAIPAMSFEDAAGNANANATTADQVFDTTSSGDTTPPTVTITDNAVGVARGAVTFTFTFSEDVGTSFAADDITVAGGTSQALNSVSTTVATLVVTPPADSTGTLTVTVAAMSFQDGAGNLNVDAITAEQDFDTTSGAPFNGVVFDDGFGAGVAFEAFDNSVNDISLDTTQTQTGTAALRIVVPNTEYTGGALVLTPGADVSAFDGVTFWARADSPKTLNVVGIGNDAADAIFNTEITQGLPVTTSWTQYTIPIPEPSVLTAQTGLFHFAEGADEGAYTLWLDEIRYVNLPAGTVTDPRPAIAPATAALAVGETFSIGGASIVYSIDGSDVTLSPSAPAFFNYTSSDESVATVDGFGVITAISEGMARITADLGGVAAQGAIMTNVGAGCPPTGANLAVNGDFETGDFSCVQQFLNGGTQSITTMNPSAGTYAVNLNVVTQDADTVIKFANLTPGAFMPGDTIYISFDMRGAVTPGGVVFAEFFSELSEGGTSAAEILFGGGPIFPDANAAQWTNLRTTALTGPDTAGGVTLQLKAASGAGTADIYFDNVCVSTTPCP